MKGQKIVKDIYDLSVISSLKKYDETVLEVLLE